MPSELTNGPTRKAYYWADTGPVEVTMDDDGKIFHAYLISASSDELADEWIAGE